MDEEEKSGIRPIPAGFHLHEPAELDAVLHKLVSAASALAANVSFLASHPSEIGDLELLEDIRQAPKSLASLVEAVKRAQRAA